MQLAIELAENAAGLNRENPLVGAVVSRGESVLGTGYHRHSEVEHAETIAIRKAGANTKDAVLFVNLEPCVHEGRTPPCVNAIIKSGIRKVFFSIKDPDERVNSEGERTLKNAGIKVDRGLLSDKASELNRHYLKVKKTGQPWVVVKVAMSLDGRIGFRDVPGERFSCDESLKVSHLLRAWCDGIMIGANTIRIDNPQLTCRLESFNHLPDKIDPGLIYPHPAGSANPVRITISRSLDIPNNSNLLSTSAARSVIVTGENANQEKMRILLDKGVEVVLVPNIKDGLDIHDALKQLAEMGIYNLLVEGGGKLIESLIASNLVDELYISIAPILMGEKNTVSWISGMIAHHVNDSPRLENMTVFKVGKDLIIRGRM